MVAAAGPTHAHDSFDFSFKNYICVIFSGMCAHAHMCACVSVSSVPLWGTKDSCRCLHHVGTSDPCQAIQLLSECLYLLDYLPSPWFVSGSVKTHSHLAHKALFQDTPLTLKVLSPFLWKPLTLSADPCPSDPRGRPASPCSALPEPPGTQPLPVGLQSRRRAWHGSIAVCQGS